VAVIGAGGLGGHVIMLLFWVGLGHLMVIDFDTFDETNQNHQVSFSEKHLEGPSQKQQLKLCTLLILV